MEQHALYSYGGGMGGVRKWGVSSRRTPQRVLDRNQESRAAHGYMTFAFIFSSRRGEMEGKHAGHNNSMSELRSDRLGGSL